MADKKAAKAASADDIMDTKAMRPILAQSKRGNPVSCVIALTKDKEGVILLDKMRKPKKLVSELKKAADDIGLTLDSTSLRFGHAVCDVEEDSGLLTFTVNKDAPAAMRPKLLERLRKAGFKAVEINADANLENEPEEDQAAAGAPQPPPPQADASAAPAAAEPDAALPSESPGRPADAAQLTQDLTGLVRQMMGFIQRDPSQKMALAPLATQAQASLKGGDLQQAAAEIQALRDALAQAASPDAATATQSPTPSPAIAKARQVWVATRQKVESDIDTLHGAFSSAFKGHGRQDDLTKAFRTRVDSVLGTLDEALAHKLDAVNSATDPGERAKLVQEAHTLIDGYRKHVASDPTIAQVDRNPFVPLSLQKTITASLAALSKAIT